jgi:hypothetical protein
MFERINSGFGPAIQVALLLASVFQPIALPAESVAVRYRVGSRKNLVKNKVCGRSRTSIQQQRGSRCSHDERVRESRKKLEAEIKGVLREASAIADRALTRAREAQAAGVPAVEAALTRLESIELEVLGMVPSRPRTLS